MLSTGGAISMDDVEALIARCSFHHNKAFMSSLLKAEDASGGALSLLPNGRLVLVACQLRHNFAGGKGLYESSGIFVAIAEHRALRRAAHISFAGALVVSNCSLADSEDPSASLNAPVSWIVGREQGSVLVLDSTLYSSSAGATALRLIGKDTRAVIRGSTVINATVDVHDTIVGHRQLGIVNSSFVPVLEPNHPSAIVQGPDCGVSVVDLSGQVAVATVLGRVCDPRASCTAKASGGVECKCTGNGLHTKIGSREDGSSCERTLVLDAQIVAPELRAAIKKPGNSSRLRLRFSAEGEETIIGNFSLLSRLVRHGGMGTNWTNSTGLAIRAAFGAHFQWINSAPKPMQAFVLDPAQQQYAVSDDHEFVVALGCDASTSLCPLDGDEIEAVARIETDADLLGTPHVELRIVLEVQALPSCALSSAKAMIPAGGIFVDSNQPLFVEAYAIDSEGFPINVSEPMISVEFSNFSAPLLRLGLNSNRLVAAIPASLLAVAGLYELRVWINEGWNDAAKVRCLLMTTTIWVMPSPPTKSIIIAIILGILAILLFGLMLYLIHVHSGRMRELLISFLQHEGVLGLRVAWELWVRPPSAVICDRPRPSPVTPPFLRDPALLRCFESMVAHPQPFCLLERRLQ
jgi:hypothetical protein